MMLCGGGARIDERGRVRSRWQFDFGMLAMGMGGFFPIDGEP